MTRFCYFLPLILVVGVTPSVGVKEPAVDDTEDTLVLTEMICLDGHKSKYVKSKCCDKYQETDHFYEYCMTKFQNVHPKNEIEKMVLYSKFTECIYAKRKYIKDDATLNIGHIKADAAKLHDPLAEKYMVDMYRACGRKAKNVTDAIKVTDGSSAQDRELASRLHRPYYIFVFACVETYSRHHQCPYFRWGSRDKIVLPKCRKFQNECKQILKNKKESLETQ